MRNKINSSVKSAFTLVELIVVIVILAILATIAFISFGSQSSLARDSTRMSDIGSISKSLLIYQAGNGTYPIPDDMVKIFSGGISDDNIIGYQGNAGNSIMNIIKAPAEGFKDPIDENFYTYNLDSSKTLYKLTALLESQSSITQRLDTIGVSSYAAGESRFPFSIGANTNIGRSDSISVLFEQSGSILIPIQLSSDSDITDGIEINTEATGLVAYTDNTSGAKTDLASASIGYLPINGSLGISTSTYPGCDTQDIALSNGQVWAACNVGSSVAGTGSDSYGKYFQWGNNYGFNLLGNTLVDVQIDTSAYGINQSYSGSNFFRCNGGDECYGDWSILGNNNLWGGSGTNNSSGIFEDITEENKLLMRGPCADGYHVPTELEAKLMCESIIGAGNCDAGINDTSIENTLLIPLASYTYNDWDGDNVGKQGVYWTSTPDTSLPNRYARYIYIYADGGYEYGINSDNRYHAQSVRCIKNS